MAARRIAIVRAPPGRALTGGNIFNRRIAQHATRRGWPLRTLSGPLHRSASPAWDLLVWDSLLLERVERIGAERIALLLHYLPSLQPGLERVRACELRAAEDHAVRLADFCIATSRELAALVEARWPSRRVIACEPGVSAVFRRRAPRPAQAGLITLAPSPPPRPMRGGASGLRRPGRAQAHRSKHRLARAEAGSSVALLTVANLLPAKGYERLLGILERLDHAWHWHAVGDPAMDAALAARLRGRAGQTKVANRITLHGPLPQRRVAAMMAASDLLLQPSLFESYGMAVAEAAATGLPAVAFRVGAAERIIRHGSTGLVAPAGDWETFERHLRALLEDVALRADFERNLAGVAVRRWESTFADFRFACESMLD